MILINKNPKEWNMVIYKENKVYLIIFSAGINYCIKSNKKIDIYL